MSDAEQERTPIQPDAFPEVDTFGKPKPKPDASRGAGVGPDPGSHAGAGHVPVVQVVGGPAADRRADPNAGRGSAPPEHDDLVKALDMARQAATHILAQVGTALNHAARLKLSRAFERVLVPREKRRRGRKRDAAITAAVVDYDAGMRGQQLYLKHIRGYGGMSRYRRQSAIRRLNEAIRSRRRRERGL